MANTVDVNDILGVKEAAEVLNLSSQAFSNLKSRYEDFPDPIKSLSSTPLYDRKMVETWAEAHGRSITRYAPVVMSGSYKIIAVCGRPKVGKSFITSMFVADTMGFRNACSRAGADFTECKVQTNIKNGIDQEYAVFHAPGDELMDGRQSPLSEEKFTIFINEVTAYLKEMRKLDPSKKGFLIEIFTQPSEFSKKIMAKNKLDYLIFIDTPGVSENYGAVTLEKADLVLFVLNDNGEQEATRSFSTIVNGMAPLVASSKACFLYRMASGCDDQEEYDDLQQKATDAMGIFEECFSDLRSNIISSSLDVLQPAKSVLCIPAMKQRKTSIAEQLFLSAFELKINQCFQQDNLDLYKSKMLKLMDEDTVYTDVAEDFIQDILVKALQRKVPSANDDHFEAFKCNKHNRVMTGDEFRIYWAVQNACQQQLTELYLFFKTLTSSDYPEAWKQSAIKYIYSALTSGIKKDLGAAEGGHPWEGYPPITMFAIESILANEIVDALNNASNDADWSGIYCKTLRENGIQSKSWDYVWLPKTYTDGIRKLVIISKCKLTNRVSSNLCELVKNRYTIGLQKLAEFHIWETMLKRRNDNIESAELEDRLMEKLIVTVS